jgi:hypothetical protein
MTLNARPLKRFGEKNGDCVGLQHDIGRCPQFPEHLVEHLAILHVLAEQTQRQLGYLRPTQLARERRLLAGNQDIAFGE